MTQSAAPPSLLARSRRSAGRRRFVTLVVAVLVLAASAMPAAAATPPSPPGSTSGGLGYYHPVSPARILDTRNGTGGPAVPVGPAKSIAVDVTGPGGVPQSGVSAVVLNVTAAGPTSNTFLTVYPSGEARPVASNLNVAAGTTRANLVVVKVGIDGRVRIFNQSGSTHLIVDVAGWYDDILRGFPGPPPAGGTTYTPVSPARVLDTRFAAGGASPILAGRSRVVDVTGVGGVPASGVSAVVVNVTAVDPTRNTFLTVWPAGEAMPVASNVNVEARTVVPNLVVAKVGLNGSIAIYNSVGAANVIVDVAGWYGVAPGVLAGGEYASVSPTRILDTRFGTGGSSKPIGPGGTLTLAVAGKAGVPDHGASAVVLNVTAVSPSMATFLTVFPSGETRPLASNLNVAAGQIAPNLVLVKIGADGRIRIRNQSGSTHVIADVAGWYAAGEGVPSPWPNGTDAQGPAATGDTMSPLTAAPMDRTTGAVHETGAEPGGRDSLVTAEEVDEALSKALPMELPDRSATTRGDTTAYGQARELWLHSHGYFDEGAQYPQVGRLIFHVPVSHIDIRGSHSPARQSVCSGTLVARNLVLTAAHCVVSRDWYSGENIWFDDFVFVPGQWGSVSAGSWNTWVRTVVPGEAGNPWFTWATNQEDGYLGYYFPADYAFVQFGPVDGDYPGDVAGWLPMSIGPWNSWVKDVGYPADGGFGPYCSAPRLPDGSGWTNVCHPFWTWSNFQDHVEHDPGWSEVGLGSWMSGGSSGGPMLAIRDGQFHVASVNSNGFRRTVNGAEWGLNMWGPWFNDYAFALYDEHAIP